MGLCLQQQQREQQWQEELPHQEHGQEELAPGLYAGCYPKPPPPQMPEALQQQREQRQQQHQQQQDDRSWAKEDFEIEGRKWQLMPLPRNPAPAGMRWEWIGARIRSNSRWVCGQYRLVAAAATETTIQQVAAEDDTAASLAAAEVPLPRNPAPSGQRWEWIGGRISSKSRWVCGHYRLVAAAATETTTQQVAAEGNTAASTDAAEATAAASTGV